MKKGDKIILPIIIVFLLIVLSCSFIYSFSGRNKDKIAIIKQDGKIIKKINLTKAKKTERIKIKCKSDKTEFNTILIEHNKIRFIDANCPDKVCVKSGWLDKVGETAACLPHKLLIVIEGKNKLVDEVSY